MERLLATEHVSPSPGRAAEMGITDGGRPAVLLSQLAGRLVTVGGTTGSLMDLVVVAAGRGLRVVGVLLKQGSNPHARTVACGAIDLLPNGALNAAPEADPSFLANGAEHFNLGELLRGRRVLDREEGALRSVRDARLVLRDGHLSVAAIEFDRPVGSDGSVFGGWIDRVGWLFGRTRPDMSTAIENVVIPDLFRGVSGLDASPADIAALLSEMTLAKQIAVFDALSEHDAAVVLGCMDATVLRELLAAVGAAAAAKRVAAMTPAHAVSVLSALPLPQIEDVLAHLEPPHADRVRFLLWNRTLRVGDFMSSCRFKLAASSTIGEAAVEFNRIGGRARRLDWAHVLDEEHRLVGIVSLGDLFGAEPDRRVAEVMRDVPLRLGPADPVQKAARVFERYGWPVLPVVRPCGRFIGEISRDEVDFISNAYLRHRRRDCPEAWPGITTRNEHR